MNRDQFLLIASEEDHEVSLWNFSQMSSVRLIEGGFQIRMSNGDTVNLMGAGKVEFIKHILRHSVLPNGEMPPEFIEVMEERLTPKTMTA